MLKKYLKTVMWEREPYIFPVGDTRLGFGLSFEKGILKFKASENREVTLEHLGPQSLESSNGNHTNAWKDCENETGLDNYEGPS